MWQPQSIQFGFTKKRDVFGVLFSTFPSMKSHDYQTCPDFEKGQRKKVDGGGGGEGGGGQKRKEKRKRPFYPIVRRPRQ
jgi:hypothetical protein